MLWDRQPRRARDLAEDGLRYLATGPNGVNLHLKYAQAAARTGDADDARRAIAAARDPRDLAQADDDVAAIGGEFGLSAATEHYFAGSALLLIDGGHNETATRLEQALSLYEAGPQPGEQHWFGAKAMASIDLATVRLRSGALDAAVAAMEPALALPPPRRINTLMTRLQLVRPELATPGSGDHRRRRTWTSGSRSSPPTTPRRACTGFPRGRPETHPMRSGSPMNEAVITLRHGAPGD